MYHYLVKYRRDFITDYTLSNRPVSVQSVSEHLHKTRATDPKLNKSVSGDPKRCYETVAKDLQKLRADGAIPYDAVVFPRRR
jgi:biopolymer transport protein ExbD